MTFSAPLALLGLLTLPLIAALHMLRSRSRQASISSLSLWAFLNPQLRGSSSRRIPLTFLLVLDLLIAALLSLALAGPQLGLARPILESRHLILLIDTSTSMAATDARPSRFSAALSALQDLVRTENSKNVLTVIEFGRTTATLADSRSAVFSDQIAALVELVPGGRGTGIEPAFALAQASADPETPAEVHVFTDAAYLPPAAASFEFPIVWHLYGSSAENQAVLSVQSLALSPSKFQVFARFANFGSLTVNRSAVLTAGDRMLGEAQVALEPGTSLTQSWEVLGAAQSVMVTLEGEDALAQDDFGVSALLPASGDATGLSVALVSAQPGPLLRALEAAPGTRVQVIAPDDFLPGSLFDLVVFRDALPESWPEGTVLVVDPPASSELLGVTRAETVGQLPFPQPDPLLEDIDLTGVRWDRVWTPEKIPPGLEAVLSAGPQALLLHGQTGLTELVLLLAETADQSGTPSAFARHPAFPVLIANIVEIAGGASLPHQLPAGEALILPSPNRYPNARITDPSGRTTDLGQDRPAAWEAFQVPGLYEIVVTDKDAIETIFLMGVNAGDLAESDIAPQGWPAGIETPELPAVTSSQPVSLSPWLLGLAAALLLWEAWLAWR